MSRPPPLSLKLGCWLWRCKERIKESAALSSLLQQIAFQRKHHEEEKKKRIRRDNDGVNLSSRKKLAEMREQLKLLQSNYHGAYGEIRCLHKEAAKLRRSIDRERLPSGSEEFASSDAESDDSSAAATDDDSPHPDDAGPSTDAS
ncbi:hypothetical protein CJ030_MR7G018895 [Morella rubra]|nr:hypothetical protein CJ030_MR7G018895 [Morella rubra]